MAVAQTRFYLQRAIGSRSVSRPVGLYWLAAGFISLALWAAIFSIIAWLS